MPPDTLLATLRDATAAHHARTEALVPVLDPALTLDGYAATLARFRDAYVALEAALARVEGWVEGWPAGLELAARRKLPLLERDLAWLVTRGVAVPRTTEGTATPRTDAPSVARAIGILYVLEGATLGGQVILRRIAPRLGVSAAQGASFYAGYGAETGTMWRAFTAAANAWGESHRAEWDAVIESARSTFDAITAAFARSP